MSKRRLVSVVTTLSLMAVTVSASAQEETTGTAEVSATTTTSETPAAVETNGAFAFKPGTLGIGVVFPTGGDNTADLLYFLDAQHALNLQLGFNLSITGDSTNLAGNPVEGETTVGLSLGGGYRMYKPLSGRVRPFLEPGATLAIDDFGEAGDTIRLGLFALLGVELVVFNQFTLGTGVGAGLDFSDKFKTIKLGLVTSPIIATFYW